MFTLHRGSLVAKTVKNLPATHETSLWSLGQEDTLEKGMATHPRILAWRIPWKEEPGGLQCTGLQRVGHDWVQAQASTIYVWLACAKRKKTESETRAQKAWGRVGPPAHPGRAIFFGFSRTISKQVTPVIKKLPANAGDLRGKKSFDCWIWKIPWRRAWQLIPVFLPGESHGKRSLAGYGP